jgi:hypothetical protein
MTPEGKLILLRWSKSAGRPLSIVVASVIAIGCGRDPDCLVLPRPFIAAVNLDMRDSITGAPADAGASVFARMSPDSTWHLTVQVHSASPGSTHGVGQEGGTWYILVRKPGYLDWFSQRIDVGTVEEDSGCWVHPVTVTVTARLQRSA